MEKVHLRLTCVAQNHLYFRFSLFSNATRASTSSEGKKRISQYKEAISQQRVQAKANKMMIYRWCFTGKAIIRGMRLFQILLTGSRALCFIFALNQKIITSNKLNMGFLSVPNLVP